MNNAKLKFTVQKLYASNKRALVLNNIEIRKAVYSGEFLSTIRHEFTNYIALCNNINDQESDEVANLVVHKLQNYVNGRLDDIKNELISVLIQHSVSLETRLTEQQAQVKELQNIIIQQISANQAIKAEYRDMLADMIQSKEDFTNFVAKLG